MKRAIVVSFLLLTCGLCTVRSGSCDTIYTRENKEIKGIILEEYKDRVLISTVDGERSIMKTDVRELYFDTEEQNLIKLAEQARDRGDFIKSFVYYDKAFRANPNSKAAKDGIVFLQGYLFKKDMAKKEEDINRRNDFEERGSRSIEMKTEEEKFVANVKKLHHAAGLSIRMEGAQTQVDNVTIGSPAYEAGIKRGDVLVAVWGRLVRYLSMPEVIEMLLEKTSLETKCTVERDIDVGVRDFGADFKMQFDGMTVSEVKDPSSARTAGLLVGDIVVSINGQSTRYMPLKKALETIKSSRDNAVKLTIRRDLVIWGKAGG